VIKKDYGIIIAGPFCLKEKAEEECDFHRPFEGSDCYDCVLAKEYSFFTGENALKTPFEEETCGFVYPKLPECARRFSEGAGVTITATVETDRDADMDTKREGKNE
jgi:hypothetical protein